MLADPKWERGEEPRMPYQIGDLVKPSAEYLWRGKGPGLVVYAKWPWTVRVKWHNLKRPQQLHIKFVEPHSI